MTLRDIFQHITANPKSLYYYFLGLPFICFLLFFLIKNPYNSIKIKWVFSALLFLSVMPGIFSLTLNIYSFLFEKQSILDLNLYTQVMPIVSMFFCLYLIKSTLPFAYIPGFEKLSLIFMLIFGLMAVMWIIDRTHILVISIIPISYIFVGFLLLILFLRYGLGRLF